MKFFIDTADLAEIKSLASSGLLDGVTTNPTLIGKSGGNTSRSCRCAFVIASILRPADRRIFVRHLGLRYLLDGRLPVSLDAGR